jgi:hypothetical protein
VATTMDLTQYDAVLHDYYTEEKIKEQSYYDNPLLAMMPRKRAGGRRYVQTLEFGNPGGASSNFTKAMANATTSKYDDLLIGRKKQYQRVLVDHETLLSSENPEEAFQPAFDEFDKGYRSLGEKLARRMYRTGGGTIGQVTLINNATVPLVDKADVFNFQIGQLVNLYSADSGGAVRGAGATLSVTNLDREAGTVTFNAAPNTLAGAAINDFLVPDGDYDLALSGLEDWLPINTRAAKLAANFFGLVRNQDADRLGGIYLDGTTLGGIDEILIKLIGKCAKHGGRPSHIFMNPETVTDLQLLWNSKSFVTQDIYTRVRSDSGAMLEIGFPGIRVNIGGFAVRIYGDRNCPSNRIYALQMNTWRFWHSGELFGFLGEKFTGKILKLAESEDSLEARVGSYCNIGCSAPGWNGMASIPVS